MFLRCESMPEGQMALKKYKDFRGEVKLIKEINPEWLRWGLSDGCCYLEEWEIVSTWGWLEWLFRN